MAPLITVSANSTVLAAVLARRDNFHIRWVPLIILVVVVIIIVTVICLPKTWLISLYDRARRCIEKNPTSPTASSVPLGPDVHASDLAGQTRRVFAPFSMSRRQDDKEQRRREESDCQHKGREEAFVDVHLGEIRSWKKPELEAAQARQDRAQPTGLAELGMPLPVLHPDKSWKPVQRKPFLYPKGYAGFKQWLKDEEAEKMKEGESVSKA